MQLNKNTKNAVGELASVSLEELDSVKLLDRQDTKFIFGNSGMLRALLGKLQKKFKILEIDGRRVFGYENMYFDTSDLLFYRQHHNQYLSRYKVRYRKYLDSDLCFLEVKKKNNKKRTIKTRMVVDGMKTVLTGDGASMVKKQTGVNADILVPTIDAKFSRMTLVGESFKERITLDFGLQVRGNGRTYDFTDLTIAEIKQDRFSAKSDIFPIMRGLGIHDMRISKYCMGILYTYDKIKYNRFKPKVLSVNKIIKENKPLEFLHG